MKTQLGGGQKSPESSLESNNFSKDSTKANPIKAESINTDSANNFHISQSKSNSTKDSAFSLDSIDYFVFYDKPFLKFERLLETYLTTAPRGFASFIRAIPVWLKEKLFLKETLSRELSALYAELYPHKSKQELKAFKAKVIERLRFSEHHFSHASGAFYPSPFAESAILTIDGVGEWSTTSIAKGEKVREGAKIEILKELHFPHSLGLLYSAFTYYTGFKVNSGEYKVMGLAPYGTPKYAELIKRELIDIKPDGSFRLNMKYFSYTYGLKMTNARFDALFSHLKRDSEGTLTQEHMDLAASIQAVTEEIMLALARTALKVADSKNLCLSGGVALNCVGNGKIYKALKSEGVLEGLWIQPASGDAGSAIGCALGFYYENLREQGVCGGVDYSKNGAVDLSLRGNAKAIQNTESKSQKMDCHADKSARNDVDSIESAMLFKTKINKAREDSNSKICDEKLPQRDSANEAHLGVRRSEAEAMRGDLSRKAELHLADSMRGAYLGLSFNNDEVESALNSLGATYERLPFSQVLERTAKALSEGKVVGWHQGRSEFGPRALGARSILGDARNTTMQKQMNLKIKYRESFRPFAPSVLSEHLSEYFELDCTSPYMLLVAPVAESKRKKISEQEQKLFGIEKLNCIRSEIPSVTHVDYSARIQSVHKETNPRYYALLSEFYKLTNCPVLVNTSFNVRGEPIVCTPEHSFACFMGCEMDMLVIEDFVLYKENQSEANVRKYRDLKESYELD